MIDPRTRRLVLWSLPVGAAAALLLLPLDGAVMDVARRVEPSGDVRRELRALQQYGQGVSLAIVAALVVALQPARWRRLLDLGAAALLTGLAVAVVKRVAGRARPRFDDPWAFVGPFGSYEEAASGKVFTVWAENDLQSMPSSHTSAAVVLSVFLVALHPRLRWIAIALAAIVGTCRVLWLAHYPSDVVVGALAGFVIGTLAIRAYAGVRLVDWLWRRFIDRDAIPALPALLETERNR